MKHQSMISVDLEKTKQQIRQEIEEVRRKYIGTSTQESKKVKLNPSSSLSVRKKISESKIGMKRVYRQDGTYYYERVKYAS